MEHPATGMKPHIGVSADSGSADTVLTTAANVNDVTQAHALLYEETNAFGDAGYTGVAKREEINANQRLYTPLADLRHSRTSIKTLAELEPWIEPWAKCILNRPISYKGKTRI